MHKIVVKVKRIGGGFGGKETAALKVALPCAVAAMKYSILRLKRNNRKIFALNLLNH